MLLSDPASRRQPLHLTRPSPPSGWSEDFHLQTAEHAQHTTKPLARRTLRVVVWVAVGLWQEYFMGHKEVPVTQLRKKMLEELQRRNYAQSTVKGYLRIVQDFAQHFRQPPDKFGPDHLRQYQAHLFQDKKLNAGTVQQYVAALRFFFNKTLTRHYLLDDIPMPKRHRKLPEILGPDEVALLIDSASNLFHQTILMTLYSTGMRRAELCHLKTTDIDSQRMMVHIRQAKGGNDRDVPLSQKLLETLRVCGQWINPRTFFFPGTGRSGGADVPINTKVPWEACRQAAHRAGITKHVSPHTLRHCFATH